ncbi:MAG: PorV/PorQ family protein [Deferribacteres bacterium]|nr:PorV/PorQ family protein [candidate division KSB1 bacterium]MCB9501035.1 PorV/PorQ family protein [Deferribacteres bacterium]
MRNTSINKLLFLLLSFFVSQTMFAQQKLAQTGFQFLSVSGDARAVAMAEAFTTVEGQSGSLFYNPALIARTTKMLDAQFNLTNWIADIKHNSGSFAYSLNNGSWGVVGFSFQTVDYGEIIGTRRVKTSVDERGYVETGNIAPSAYMFGLGYAYSLTDRFAVGAQIKTVHQDLGDSWIPSDPKETEPDSVILEKTDNTLSEFAIDFGTIYRTGFKSLAFGMSVRNYSRELKYVREGFQLPLTFQVGVSMNVLDLLDRDLSDHAVLVSIDAAHPRSYPEYLNLGMEYTFMKTLALRAGYKSNQDEYGISYGVGFQLMGAGIDFAYTPFPDSIFEDVTRLSMHFEF